MDINMTEYEKAVNMRGVNIAVSASAGCGKTTTMIKRITDIILKEHIEVSNILVVTFTRAAAAEMKQKLKDELLKYCNDEFISRQIKDLEISDISTIHSFCSKICGEFFNIAEIPPDFSIMEEKDISIYKNKILSQLMEDYYDSKDDLFFELSQIFSSDRTDEGLMSNISRLYNMTVTTDAENFLNKTAFLSCEKDLNANALVAFLNEDICLAAEDLIHRISVHITLCKNCGLVTDAIYIENIKSCLTYFDKFKNIEINAGCIKELLISCGRLKGVKKDGKDDMAISVHESTKTLKSRIKDIFEKFNDSITLLFDENTDIKLASIKKYLGKLCEITLKFRNSYMQFKKDNSMLDFNDLEYYTLKIMQNEKSRETLKKRYCYIFVDEFQDTNRLQDEIITYLESSGNLFIVGDTKQSIYKFRGAENEIFKEKSCQGSFGNVTLGINFRSDKNILNFINVVFSYIMRESFSLVNYSSAVLTGVKNFKLSDGRPSVIVDILPEPPKKHGASYEGGIYSVKKHSLMEKSEYGNGAAEEGRHIAYEIKKLIQNKTKIICNDEELQKRIQCGKNDTICYDDITVLVRAKKVFTEEIYNQLLQAGIPVSAEFSYSLYEYFEITQLIDYLKLIDNFMQDIPLLAVLKSCIGRFTDDELSEIRISCREGRFYEAVKKYIENGSGELCQKLKNFYGKTMEYAALSKTLPCPRLLMQIIKDFKYEQYLLTLEGGNDFVARVDAFLNIIYQKVYSYNLSEFLYFIENAADEIKLGPKAGSQISRIHLCTIHTSKGLEYPVVFIAGCGQKFLFSDDRQKLLIHRKYGLATDYYDFLSRKKESSFIRNSLGKQLNYEQVKEEINILYVAMTRAKYRLYLCGAKDVGKYVPLLGLYDIKNSDCYFDYILNVAVCDKKNYGKTENMLYCNNDFDTDYEFNIINSENAEIIKNNTQNTENKNEILPLSDYEFIDSTKQPLKNSVSSLNPFDNEEYGTANVIYEGNRLETGTAYHKVLEYIDFYIKKEDIKDFIFSLTDKKILTLKQAEGIDENIIYRLLSTDIFKSAAKNKCYREKPFMAILKSYETGGITDDDVLVQGVLDLLIIQDGGAVIIDYKYSGRDDGYLKERYYKQLKLYSLAVSKILNINVEKCTILNIFNAIEIEIC